MKTALYYFSSTGNSLYIARQIAEKLGDTSLISIPRAMKGELTVDADRVGIIFPVYVWGLPRIVREFIEKLPEIKGRYVFALATYGGTPADTLKLAQKCLRKRNIELSASFGIAMPNNYTPFYAVPEPKQKEMFAKADEALPAIVESIRNNEKTKLVTSGFINGLIFTSILYNFSISHFRKADKSFKLKDNCNGCGICKKVCPVDNIEMKDRKPVWLNNCEHCLGCLHWCPEHAIEFGKTTLGRPQYRHPSAKASDFPG